MALVAVAAMLGPAERDSGTATAGSGPASATVGGAAGGSTGGGAVRLATAYGRTPLAFLAPDGKGSAAFVARGRGYAVSVSAGDAVLSLAAGDGKAPGPVVRMRVLDGDPGARPVPDQRSAGTTNLLLGTDRERWLTGLTSYGRVRYEAVYPGIDLVYHGDQSALEYDFVVAPGADAARIGLRFDGVDGVAVDADGDLVLSTGAGPVRHRRPVLYQEVRNERRAVPGGYALDGERVGFRVGAYDSTRPLVIDPIVGFATYLGGGNDDRAEAIAVDAAGNAWVTGSTPSPVFPTTAGAFRAVGDDLALGDAFVTKFRPDGSVVYSTYLGGNDGFDGGLAVDIDGEGDGAAFVTGVTTSTDLPVTPGALDRTCGTDGACNPEAPFGRPTRDAFVVKLDPSGSSLVYATYLGGSGAENGVVAGGVLAGEQAGLAVGPAGEAVVTGTTESADFPVTGGALQPAQRGASDVFVAKLNTAGSALAFATYLGGSGADAAAAVAVEGSGVVVTGTTASADFPVKGALQPVLAGTTDAFVAKLDADGTALAYATYLGGGGFEVGSGVAVDRDGAAYVAGSTSSAGIATAGAYDTTCGSDGTCDAKPARSDAFVAKFDRLGSQLVWATYLGGSGSDAATAVDVWEAPGGGTHTVVTGQTTSADLPLQSPIQARYGGAGPGSTGDAFVAELAPGGGALVHATYLGGVQDDEGVGVGTDAAGNTYVAGSTTSADFPTMDAFQPGPSGGLKGLDAIVAKLVRSDPSLPTVTGVEPPSGPARTETTVVITGTGLAGATEVHFGDVPAAVVRTDPAGAVTVTAPALAAGPVDVRVTVPGARSARSPFARFHYAEGAWRTTGGSTVRHRLRHSATQLLDGTVLVAGGCTGSSVDACGPARISAELFDPRLGTWAATAETMLGARLGHTATRLPDGRVLVVGGRRNAPVADAELYDPARRTWRPAPPMTTPREGHTATSLGDGSVLVVGGDIDGRSAERYHPGTGTWGAVAPPSYGRRHHSATLLPDGRVLVVGGEIVTCDGCPPPPEVYDPAANRWAEAPDTVGPAGRFGHAATLLAGSAATCGTRCDRVVVTGGFTDRNFFRMSANTSLFGPVAGWSTGRSLPVPRAGHTGTLLPNGKVLVVGGSPGRAAELYDPREGRWISAGISLGRRAVAREWSAVHTATLLEGDAAACGANCGKVLVVGGSELPQAELYTPLPSVTSVSPAAAPAAGGTRVVVSGTGLATTRSVLLGERPVPFTIDSPSQLSVVLPASSPGVVDLSVVTEGGRSAGFPIRLEEGGGSVAAAPSSGAAQDPPPGPPPPPPRGYRLAGSDGGVFAFGGAGYFGSMGGVALNQPVVAMAATPSNRGYWLVGADGGVFAFGDARFHGSTADRRLNHPVVAIAATRSGNGYWLVAADGGVFAFGDARFRGSTGGIRLAQPVVGIAASPTGGGYRLVAADGGIFAFGDARFLGSAAVRPLNRPVVAVAVTPSGDGYWLMAADGGVFAFGDARFAGSAGATPLNRPIVAAAAPTGNGYLLVASDGGVFAFGSASFAGSAASVRLNRPIVGVDG